MRYLFRRRGSMYMAFALGLVSFGLIRLAFAHVSGDLCALETTEKWSWTGYGVTYVTGSEVMQCVNAGCTAQGGTCPSAPAAHPLNPFNVGDQDGDQQDDWEWYYTCPCNGIPDDDPAIEGGYCETQGVKKSWLGNSDPNQISIRCLRILCTNECTVEEWTDPPEPVPPNEFKKKETCACP